MRQYPVGNVSVELGQTFLGDACVGPQDSVWVCKSFTDRFAVNYFGFLRRRLKRDLVRGTIFAQTLERRLANELVSRPPAKFHFADELRLGPAHTLFGRRRHGITQRRFGATELIQ